MPTTKFRNVAHHKLSEEDVAKIRKLRQEQNLPMVRIAERFDVKPDTISKILKGETHKSN